MKVHYLMVLITQKDMKITTKEGQSIFLGDFSKANTQPALSRDTT
jgi:hypothetical protein